MDEVGSQIFRTHVAKWKAGDPSYALVEHLIELLPLVTGKENRTLTEALALGEMAGESQRWFSIFFFPLPRKSCKGELASLSTDTYRNTALSLQSKFTENLTT